MLTTILLYTEIKKDPGIPNLFPFKEQLLKQMEDRKVRAEENKARQKAQRQKEQAKRRSLQGLTNDAQKRTREFEKKVTSKSHVCLHFIYLRLLHIFL